MRVDRVVITGGAGFIGSNTAEHYLRAGARVTILDNFSRRGSESNAEWLQQSSPPGRLTIVRADVRSDHDALSRAIDGADVVFHLAAQVAVTTSVTNPREDFEINALGTFNVLEAVRSASSKPIVVYSSTNKVYGKMGDAGVIAREGRYEYEDLPYIAAAGPACFPVEHYFERPAWRCLESTEDLSSFLGATSPALSVHTLGAYIEDAQLRERVLNACEPVRTFPGTLGGGDVVVCRPVRGVRP